MRKSERNVSATRRRACSPGTRAHQLEDALVRDAIELGTELERRERIEVRRLRRPRAARRR